MSIFENRLRKNARHFRKWAKRQGLTAYRIYDRDAPEYPLVVEWYEGRVHLVEFPSRRMRREATDAAIREEALATVSAVLEIPLESIFTKSHQPQPWGRSQYGKQGSEGHRFAVSEQGLRFEVNLGDYLDTGLFLDHRLTRARVREEASGKRFLNLFAYTGSFTVYAAAGGAKSTTTVDLSNTYCEWAARNLNLNGYSQGAAHQLLRSDVVRWVRQAPKGSFDLIILDPPSFSTSSKMAGSFNVQRDHPRLLAEVLELLAPEGALYFSTNYQGFELLEPAGVELEELTPGSIPEDFHFKEIHRCWRIRKVE